MKCGEECEIVEYNDCDNIIVRFVKTGELVKSRYGSFKRGSIKSHFTPTVYGVGVVGLETTRINGKLFKSYYTWQGILERCYSKKYQEKYPTYKGCKVCDEWKYYKNFKEWYDKNYYEIEEQKMALDKDILVKGNKIYNPDNCVFVPQDINKLFTKNDINRGGLPIGVCWHESRSGYQARCNIFDIVTKKSIKSKHLGLYNTPDEAFKAYKRVKEENIKQVADYHREQIPNKLYEAMYKYQVDVDD